MTLTCPVFPACLTASAAPGTAGEQIAIINFTLGLALMIAVASLNALSLRSSQGRKAARVSPGYFSAFRFSMAFCQSIMFPAVKLAVNHISALGPNQPAAPRPSACCRYPGVALTKNSRESGKASAS